MKKNFLLFCLIVGAAISGQQERQSRFEKKNTIRAEFGYMPSMFSYKESGYTGKISYTETTQYEGFMGKIDFFLQNYPVDYMDRHQIPYEKYGINFQAGWSYEGIAPIFLNAYLGLFGAYEIANKGNKKDPIYNANIPVKSLSGFSYGATMTGEIEFSILENLGLILDYTQSYDLGSVFSKLDYSILAGVVLYVN